MVHEAKAELARETKVREEVERIKKGGPARNHEKSEQLGKIFVRDRLKLFFDEEEVLY